jgi:hypothetical protein
VRVMGSVEIDRPASEVWAYVADYGNDPSWRAHDRQKQLQGSRLVEPTGSASCRFTEVLEGRLLGLVRSLEPMIAWLLQRQATADMRRLRQLLEAPSFSGSAPEETAP